MLAWTGRIIADHSVYSCVTDFIEIGQPEACANSVHMHDDSISFQWDYIQRNNAVITASYITNYFSKVSSACFTDHKVATCLIVIK